MNHKTFFLKKMIYKILHDNFVIVILGNSLSIVVCNYSKSGV